MLLTPAEASRLSGEHLACLPIELLPVGQCAGAILRENVYAERDQPLFDRVAMDGTAIQATQAAGDPPLTLASADPRVEIMTGTTLRRTMCRAPDHPGPRRFAALAGTDGFVELPPGPHDHPKGFVARLYRCNRRS